MKGRGITLLLTDLHGKAGDSFVLRLLRFKDTVQDLAGPIKAAEAGKKTNIIQLYLQNTDPVLARDVVNTLVQAYLDKTVALKAEEASRTVEFAEEQLKGVRDELDKAELNLQQYKSNNGVVKLDSEADELIKKFSESEKERAGVILQKKQMEFALASLKDAVRKGTTYSPAAMAADPLVAGMAAKLADLEVQKKALLGEYTREHPLVKSLQGQIDESLRKIQATYETSRKNLAKEEADIAGRLAEYEAVLKRMPSSERDLARLLRLSKVNADVYTFLLQKHEEGRIAKASTISNINIIDPAIIIDEPVKPKKLKNMIIGLLVGCMLGVGIAFFSEYLDNTLKDAEEIKRFLGIPLLGFVPHIPQREGSDNWSVPVAHHLPRAQSRPFRGVPRATHRAPFQRRRAGKSVHPRDQFVPR